MSARVKKSFLWLWMAALLSATIGISVQQIYCYCVGASTFTIFAQSGDACAAATVLPVKDACCSVKQQPASCCSADSDDTLKGHDCTKKSVKVFQLKTEFLVGQPLDWGFDLPIWAGEFPEYLRMFRPVVCEARFTNKSPPTLPPPLSGRLICLRHELFRC